MPFVKFRTDLVQDPEINQEVGVYKISIGKESLRIERPPRPLCHLKWHFNIDPMFIEIAAKVSAAIDITVFGDEMFGSTEDEEGGSPNIGASTVRRGNNDGSSKRYSSINQPQDGQTEADRLSKYDELPYSAYIELLSRTLKSNSTGSNAILAADIWRYGKYLESAGFLTEAYLTWIKVIELFSNQQFKHRRLPKCF